MAKDPRFSFSNILGVDMYGDLINAETALSLAAMVFEYKFGRDELIKRLPLQLVDGDQLWEICAPYKPTPLDRQEDGVMLGSFHIAIMKSDGQIFGLFQEAQYPVADGPPIPDPDDPASW